MAPPTTTTSSATTSSDNTNLASSFITMPRVSQPEPEPKPEPKSKSKPKSRSKSKPKPATSIPNPESNLPSSQKPHASKSNSTHTISNPNPKSKSKSKSSSLPEPHVSKFDPPPTTSNPNPDSKSLPMCCVIGLEAVPDKRKTTGFSNKGRVRKKGKKENDNDNVMSKKENVSDLQSKGANKVEVGNERSNIIKLSALSEFGDVKEEFIVDGFQLLSEKERKDLEKDWFELNIAQMEGLAKKIELHKKTLETLSNAVSNAKR